jgi:lipoprotein-releasing system ATP-binding protein
MSELIIDCQNVTKSYIDGSQTITVLNQLSCQISANEMVAIVGSSGSGKSTLMHLLAGLDKPTEGVIKVGGYDLSTLTENEKCQLRNQQLGFVFQFHHLLPEFSALENICMPMLIAGWAIKVAIEKADAILESVGLAHRRQHKINELSGGERQRVAIARALVMNPRCILADEPTGNLDEANANKMLQVFFELQSTFKTAVILVTHDKMIASQADRILKLTEGKLQKG